jgi:hypothetical protein
MNLMNDCAKQLAQQFREVYPSTSRTLIVVSRFHRNYPSSRNKIVISNKPQLNTQEKEKKQLCQETTHTRTLA